MAVPKDVDNMATPRTIIKCIIPTLLDHKVTTIRMQPLGCTVALLIIIPTPSILNRGAGLIHQDHGAIRFLVREGMHQLEVLAACTINNNSILTKEGNINSNLHNNVPKSHLSLP